MAAPWDRCSLCAKSSLTAFIDVMVEAVQLCGQKNFSCLAILFLPELHMT